MSEEKIYDAIDPKIKKKYNKRFVRSICAIDDLLEKKRYIYDSNETGKNGGMEQLIDLLNNLYEENQQLKEKLDLHILLTDNERQKTRNQIKKLLHETEDKQEKEPNILQDIKELLILLCKTQINNNQEKYEKPYDFVYATKKEDLIREEYNKRLFNKQKNKYFKNPEEIKSIDGIDLYGLITEAIYTRLDLFFEKGEWHDMMLEQISENIVKQMQEKEKEIK